MLLVLSCLCRLPTYPERFRNDALIRLGHVRPESAVWAAAGFKDTLLRWKMKPEVVHGEKNDIQPRVQARDGLTGR